MELGLRKHYQFKNTALSQTTNKAETVKLLKLNPNVRYQWHCLTNEETNTQQLECLYTTFIEQFVTIRGFYYTSSIIESYKTISKKILQKAKALRKTI